MFAIVQASTKDSPKSTTIMSAPTRISTPATSSEPGSSDATQAANASAAAFPRRLWSSSGIHSASRPSQIARSMKRRERSTSRSLM